MLQAIMSIDSDPLERYPIGSQGPSGQDLSGHTLVLPVVSIGSVPQLAIDLLLANPLHGEQAQYLFDLDSQYCIPFCGAEPSSGSHSPTLRTPLQVFTFPQNCLTVVQQRSPIVRGQGTEYVQALWSWIQRRGFAQVVVLSSTDAGRRHDRQMDQPFWRYGPMAPVTPVAQRLATMVPFWQADESYDSSQSKHGLPALPSSGLTRKIITSATTGLSSIPTMALVAFAAEGDNRADAKAMAQLLWMASQGSDKDGSVARLREPDEWQLLFGVPLTMTTDMAMF